jgi:tetratricopeptide (TPR) repeat protein
MSQIESSESLPKSATESTEEAPAEETPAAPEPEPWTSERVAEWNRYYDLYVALTVLALLFVAAAHRITEPQLWSQIKAGEVMVKRGTPLVTDIFSFSEKGQTWVDVPWVFELTNYGIYHLGLAASASWGAPALVIVNALLFLLTGFVLMRLCKSGPGLWWAAFCVAFALGIMLVPTRGDIPQAFILQLGGLPGSPSVTPQTWGMLFLALELLLLHKATKRVEIGGATRSVSAYLLIPLFLIWANVDESFLLGLLLAAAWILTEATVARRKEPPPLPLPRGLMILGACALICLVNPALYRIYPAAVEPFTALLTPSGVMLKEQMSFFGSTSLGEYSTRFHSEVQGKLYRVYYVVMIGIGLASFVLNRRRFSPGRLAAFLLASIFWAIMMRLATVFAVVLAATLILNGQEWYHDRFGTEGRMGRGWTLWSVGGRAITLLLLIAALFKGLTGYTNTALEPAFGFGVNPDEYPFEVADYLRDPKIEGNVLNCNTNQGDALIWRAYPDRLSYIDDRRHVFPASRRAELLTLMTAFRDSDPDTWRPILDRLGVSVVLMDPRNHPITYANVARSSDWILFYDDGNSVLFGRADAKPNDLAIFKSRQLNADDVVFHRPVEKIPFVDRPPTKTTWLDSLFRRRTLVSPQSHVLAGERWLERRSATDPQIPYDPANAFAAIRQLRIALQNNPDDPYAYRLLAGAYELLTRVELSILSRGGASSGDRVLSYRSRQHATALNFAILTTPPPTNSGEKLTLADLYFRLATLYRGFNYFDLERDALAEAEKLSTSEVFGVNERARLDALNKRIDQVQSQLTDFTAERNASGIERADFLLQRGMLDLAMRELEEAEQQGQSRVKARLLDIYSQIGRADKALELLGELNMDDPALMDSPGSSSYRQGYVHSLFGNYDNTANLWLRALSQLRASETVQALGSVQSFLHGTPREAANSIQELPNRVATQADWEFDLGFCLLEAGKPVEAAEYLAKSIDLNPNHSARRLSEYYLQRLGKPYKPAEPPATTAAEPKADASDGDKGKDGAPKPAEPTKSEVAPNADKPKDEASKPSEKATEKVPEAPK